MSSYTSADYDKVFIKPSTRAPPSEYALMDVDDLYDASAATGATYHEIVMGECLPYFDIESSHKTKGELAEALETTIPDVVDEISSFYDVPEQQVHIYSASGKHSDIKKAWYMSLHAVVQGAGHYESGAHLKRHAAELLNWIDADMAVYGGFGSVRTLRMLNSTKDDGSRRLIEMRQFEGVWRPFVMTRASFEQSLICRIGCEALIDVEIPAVEPREIKQRNCKYPKPTAEQVRKVVMNLKSSRADVRGEWRDVLFALGDTARQSNLVEELRAVAHDFSKQCGSKYNQIITDQTYDRCHSSTAIKSISYASLIWWLKADAPAVYNEMFKPVQAFAALVADSALAAVAADTPIDGAEPRLEDLAPMPMLEEKEGQYKKKGEWHYADRKYFKIKSAKSINVNPIELNQYFSESIIHAMNEGNSILFSRNRMPDGTTRFTPIVRAPFQSKLDDFKINLAGAEEQKTMSELYREHYQAHCYDYVEFVPFLKDDPTPSNVFNKFPGFKHPYKELTPAEFKDTEELVAPIIEHFKVIGAQHWKLLLDMMCDIAQNPRRKPTICFVIKSKQGAGKNILFEFVMRTIGDGLCNMFQEIGQLTNKFNTRLESKLFNICNEVANFAGHKVADVMKARITDSDLTIEPKGINTYQVRDYARYALLSNNDYCVRVEPGCRRYIVVESSPAHVFDTAYFTRLAKCMADHEVEFWNYMCNRDISAFDPYMKAPMSGAKRQIMMESISPVVQFVEAVANSEIDVVYTLLDNNKTVSAHHISFNGAGELVVPNTELYAAFKTWVGDNLPGRNVLGAKQFVRELRKLAINKDRHMIGGKRRMGFKVDKATLETAMKLYLRDDAFMFDVSL